MICTKSKIMMTYFGWAKHCKRVCRLIISLKVAEKEAFSQYPDGYLSGLYIKEVNLKFTAVVYSNINRLLAFYNTRVYNKLFQKTEFKQKATLHWKFLCCTTLKGLNCCCITNKEIINFWFLKFFTYLFQVGLWTQ